jgi:hypothetical integral membrane protein (TIGR02206 family)
VEDRFQLFALDHLLTLGVVAAIGAMAVSLARRPGRAKIVRVALAAFLVLATASYLAVEATLRSLDALDFLPLHLCDMAIFVAIFALLSRSIFAAEVLYFWACSGTVLAMITPDVWYAFPHRHFIAYFALHGGVVIAALVLTFGAGLRPRSGSPWRAFLFTNAYAALVALANLALGTNFLYLFEKPSAPTVLDLLGPWPIYIAAVELIALACFRALYALGRRRIA